MAQSDTVKQEIRTDCWCYLQQKQVIIHGVPRGKRQADLIEVTNCQENCVTWGHPGCLVGTLREGVWTT